MIASDYKVRILDLAERGELPEFISDDSVAPRRYFRELYDIGWLSGVECPGEGEPDNFRKLKITELGIKGLVTMFAERRQVNSRRLGVAMIIGFALAIPLSWLGVQMLQRFFENCKRKPTNHRMNGSGD